MWRVNELCVTEMHMNIGSALSLTSWFRLLGPVDLEFKPRSINRNTWSVIVPMPIVIITPIQCEPKNVESNVTERIVDIFLDNMDYGCHFYTILPSSLADRNDWNLRLEFFLLKSQQPSEWFQNKIPCDICQIYLILKGSACLLFKYNFSIEALASCLALCKEQLIWKNLLAIEKLPENQGLIWN